MTPMKRKQIKVDIDAFIKSHGGDYAAFYVGVSANAKRRLFNEHQVARKGAYTRRRAFTADKAREVEQHFLNKGCEGDTGGGEDTADRIYAYKMTAATDP